MSRKTRNIIAAVIGAVAVLAVVAVIILACITVRPADYADGWMRDYEAVEIYRNGVRMNGVDANGKIVGDGEHSGTYSYDDIINSLDFSLFSACLQFNYDFGLRLSKDTLSSSKITSGEIRTAIDGMTSANENGYTFIIRLKTEKSVTLTDKSGKTATQVFDAVVFTLSEDSDWVRDLEAFVFSYDDLYVSSDAPGANTAEYYKVKFGARTSAAIDMLDLTYGDERAPAEDDDDDSDGNDDDDEKKNA